jgi:hypothetical protein
VGFRGKIRRVAGAGGAVAFTAGLLVAAAPGVQAAEPIYYIRNANNSSVCLTANNTTAEKNSVFTTSCVNVATQRWRITGGKFTNQSGAKNYCLETEGRTVYTFRCETSTLQQWTTDSTAKKWIRHNLFDTYCVHSSGATSGREYAQFKLCTQSSRWTFDPV